MKQTLKGEFGSTLLIAVLTVAILASIGAVTIMSIQRSYRGVHQTSAWQEALVSAEAGVDLAMVQIRKSVSAPGEEWAEGWHSDNAESTSSDQLAEEPGSSASYTAVTLLRQSEGGQRSYSRITVDVPLFDERGEPWYRIRSLGIAEIAGGAVVASEKGDTRLRKFDLIYDRLTKARVVYPRATRMIEAVAKPVGVFGNAILGDESVRMTDHNIVVDSYDSRDDSKSTNGKYDPAKAQENGNVSTNSSDFDAGHAHIHGSAYTNGGSVEDSENITGEIHNDFYQELPSVTAPGISPDPGTPESVRDSTVLTAQAGSPSHYKLSEITLTSDKVLRIQGDPQGGETYIEILVTGSISTKGFSSITIDPGVYVRIFVQGDVDIAGGGIVNPNLALNLQIYGVEPPEDQDGTKPPRDIKIAGSGTFTGAIYAPDHDITLVGGGNATGSSGSFIGKSVRMTGIQSIHYDEALVDGGLIADYRIVSWFEDTR